MEETLSDRIGRLTVGLSDTQVGEMMGTTSDAARKLRLGEIRSIKLNVALRLCRRLNVSPWYLAGISEPAAPIGEPTPPPADDRVAALESQVVAIPELQLELAALNERVALALSTLRSLRDDVKPKSIRTRPA